MRQPRVYLDLALHTGDLITLPPETSHYLTQVLRLKSGDLLLPFNAVNGEYSAAIDKSDRKHTSIIIQEQQRAPSPETFSVHLGLGLSRGDRMDFAIQKSTELGVAAITPLYTLYSEVKFKQADRIDKKLSHWRKIAVSAAEQSGRLSVPKLQQPMAIEQWLETTKSQMKLILSPGGNTRFAELSASESCDLLIGSEGGFSPDEVKQSKKSDFVEVTMGQRVMRTETAPIAALAILQYRFGDI
jgi:16S rRNA (uracil1498-N3)-methyltransferase